jgi:hypothetical protein
MHKIRNFQEGHSTVGEWQGSGRVVAGERQGNGMVCVNRPLTRQGNGRGTSWERHGMCESALKLPSSSHEHKLPTHKLLNSSDLKRKRGHKADWTNYIFPSPRHQDKLLLPQVQHFPSHDKFITLCSSFTHETDT